MDITRKIISKRCGVGGWKCFCCGPKTSKDKKVLRRTIRRILKIGDRKWQNG